MHINSEDAWGTDQKTELRSQTTEVSRRKKEGIRKAVGSKQKAGKSQIAENEKGKAKRTEARSPNSEVSCA